MKSKKKMNLLAKQSASGWVFLTPATILIAVMAFWPMIQAFIMSLQTGSSANMKWSDPIFNNYTRMFSDKLFLTSVKNTFLYLLIQVPIMLVLAILLAQLLNNKDLKLKGFFRTCVFLPCATSLVSYSLIFRSMFATDGLINSVLMKMGILSTGYNFLGNSTSAKIVIIIALIWRWTGYNMVFYLAGLQNIEYSVYEAAKIDGANKWTTFIQIMLPIAKPGLVFVLIQTFLSAWNELQMAIIFINDTSKQPLSVVPLRFAQTTTGSGFTINNLFAACIICLLPIAVFYIFASRQLMAGLTAGAVKG